jgi:hypothetical protein
MSTGSDVPVTPGSGSNIATFSFTESSTLKQLQRINVNDSTGTELLGLTTDAAATNTDSTSLSFMMVFKQISKTLQAAASSVATAFKVQLTDGTNLATTFTAYGTAPSGDVPGANVFVTNTTPPVGAANFAPNQVSIGTTATQIAAARTGVSGTGRVSITILNTSTTPVFIGGSGVTASTGILLAGAIGASITINTTAAVFGIVSAGTATVSEWETF